MQNYFTLGQTPAEEECAQVGSPDYMEKARAECKRYIDLLRKKFGPEPAGAQLKIKSFMHDFGDYLEVVCEFDEDLPESVEYACTCDEDPPRYWNE